MKRSRTNNTNNTAKRPRVNSATVPRLPANIMGKIYAMVDPRTQARMHVLSRETVANTQRTPSAQHKQSYLTGGGKHQKLFSSLPKKLLAEVMRMERPGQPSTGPRTAAHKNLLGAYLRLMMMVRLYKDNPGQYITRIPQKGTFRGIPMFSSSMDLYMSKADSAFFNWAKRKQLRMGPQFYILMGAARKPGDELWDVMMNDFSQNGKLPFTDKERWMDLTLEWAASVLGRTPSARLNPPLTQPQVAKGRANLKRFRYLQMIQRV